MEVIENIAIVITEARPATMSGNFVREDALDLSCAVFLDKNHSAADFCLGANAYTLLIF